MSVLRRLALVDDRTTASNPGRVSVEWFRFICHFPFWPALFAGGVVTSTAWACSHHRFWPVPVLILAMVLLYCVRIHLRFRFGCVNPSKVVSVSPFLIAVCTDLSTGVGAYPVLKILRHPMPRGNRYRLGDKCATVAMYTGSAEAEHWEDFDPIMVDCASSEPSDIASVMASIPEEEWNELEAALRTVPLPLKPGVYPLPRD